MSDVRFEQGVSAPLPWMVDEALSEDARRLLDWYCQRPGEGEQFDAVGLSVALPRPDGTVEAAVAEAVTAGYLGEGDRPGFYRLVWRQWARPDGGESVLSPFHPDYRTRYGAVVDE